MGQYHAIDRKTVFQKKERLIALVLLIVASLLLYCFCPIATARAYNKTSAIVVMNARNGEILYAENGEIKMEIASTTKILTAITVIENDDIFRVVTIPASAVGIEGSSIYLRAGEKWRIIDLLYGLMLRSGNDAAVALAEISAGSVSKFVERMNETAVKVGATKSRFTNPHGLHDEGHYASAYDLALITAYALRSPVFREIVKTKTHSAYKETNGVRENVVFYNKNKLLYSYSDAIGVKTGYTRHSGRCLVSAAERDGVNLIVVTLNVNDTYGVSKAMFERYFPKRESDKG